MKHGIVYILLGMVLLSCQPDTVCRENLDSGMNVSFLGDSIGVRSQRIPYTTWDSITVHTIGHDSILYNNAKNVDLLHLPLRPDSTQTIFTLLYHGQTDTLVVIHTPKRKFVSAECGCVFDHEVSHLRYTNRWIDTVTIVQPMVSVGNNINLQIYHHKGNH